MVCWLQRSWGGNFPSRCSTPMIGFTLARRMKMGRAAVNRKNTGRPVVPRKLRYRAVNGHRKNHRNVLEPAWRAFPWRMPSESPSGLVDNWVAAAHMPRLCAWSANSRRPDPRVRAPRVISDGDAVESNAQQSPLEPLGVRQAPLIEGFRPTRFTLVEVQPDRCASSITFDIGESLEPIGLQEPGIPSFHSTPRGVHAPHRGSCAPPLPEGVRHETESV